MRSVGIEGPLSLRVPVASIDGLSRLVCLGIFVPLHWSARIHEWTQNRWLNDSNRSSTSDALGTLNVAIFLKDGFGLQ